MSPLQPLPAEVESLLLELHPPPRLVAHLSLVHDVACQLTARLKTTWPGLAIDQRAVHLGAASHDIGKSVHPSELTEPRNLHESAGRDLLERHGWPETLSRFAVTHGRNLTESDTIEDLVVAVADKVWKGKREDGPEQALVAHIARFTRQEHWQVWMTVDDLLTSLAEAAPERLCWQALHRA